MKLFWVFSSIFPLKSRPHSSTLSLLSLVLRLELREEIQRPGPGTSTGKSTIDSYSHRPPFIGDVKNCNVFIFSGFDGKKLIPWQSLRTNKRFSILIQCYTSYTSIRLLLCPFELNLIGTRTEGKKQK